MTTDEARELPPPFQKITPGMTHSHDSMAPSESRPVYPFVKNTPPPLKQIVETPVSDSLDVPDPKDESAVASVASQELRTPIEPIVSGTIALPNDFPTLASTTDVDRDSMIDKALETSMPSLSSPTNPGSNMPPAPVTPPTKE